MPVTGDLLFRSRADIVEQLVSEFLELVPDAYMGEDGNLRLFIEVMGGIGESVFRAIQILSLDMFIQTASSSALVKYGIEFGVDRDQGSLAVGDVVFRGAGGTYIPIGTRIAHNPGGNAPILYFTTIEDGIIDNPGTPTAPSVAEGTAGVLNGLYEYAVSFVTAMGETLIGPPSSALSVSSKQISVSSIPLGGTGTLSRKLYRSLDGGNFKLVTTIAGNTTTTYTDNTAEGSLGGSPLETSTAERIALEAQADAFGTQYNVVPGAISILVDVRAGVTDVANETAFSGGTDEETTNEFRQEILDAIRAPGTGSAADLKRWAEEINGVVSATIFENDNLGVATPGHATVRIAGRLGTVPSSEIVQRVQDTLDAKDIANIVLHVSTFTQVPTDVTVDVDVNADFTLLQITPGVQSAISEYILSLDVGQTLRKSGIVDAVFGLPGVDDVSVTTPATNLTTTDTQKRIPGTITVT